MLYATIGLIGALIEVFIDRNVSHVTYGEFTRLILTYRHIAVITKCIEGAI